MNYISYNNQSLKQLKQSNIDFTKKDICGGYHLHQLSKYADRGCILYAIKQYPQALDIYDNSGMLPIHISMIHNNDEAVIIMLKYKPELGLICDDKGRTLSEIRGYRSNSLWYDYAECCIIS